MTAMGDSLDKHIGFQSIVKTYGWKDLLKDSFAPILLASFVTISAIIYSDDSHALFDKVVALCSSILPSYLGLLVAAYTLLLTLLTTKTVSALKEIVDDLNNYSGKDLLRTLNSDFAVCILVAGFALFLSVLFSICSSLNIVFLYADVVNFLGIFVMVYLLFYSLTILFNLIEDLYNIGQTTIIL